MHIRSIFRTFALASLVAVAACESGTDPSDGGHLLGTWAGEAWDGDAQAYIVNDSLYISSASDGWQNGPYVAVGVGPFHGPGTYTLGPASAAIRYIVGGDGIWASYGTRQSPAGTMVVTGFSGGTVTGSVEFVADADPGDTPAGARSIFRGDFRARTQLPRLPSR
ncbi:hypothetical protein [Longimicrobium sp.]|uniref:hypothetical protein n=1 Tax=Longimicrobium sp. TaxID=2029185 RepID=UPI002E3191F3|nr:hypothetical protein [Longimicrobium sp.]HEX6038410.1 hypothetical protein [Longimicrobium sp.]